MYRRFLSCVGPKGLNGKALTSGQTIALRGLHSKSSVASATLEYSSEPSVSSEQALQLEKHYGAHNYHPLPVVFSKGMGTKVWDPEGKEYLDFLSAYSAVNQGTLF